MPFTFRITVRAVIAVSFAVASAGAQAGESVRVFEPTAPGHQAISLLGDTLRAFPLSAEARTRYERQLGEAWGAYSRAPRNADSVVWYARRLGYLGRIRESIDVYTRGIVMYPDNPWMYRHRGHRFVSVREFDKAIADLETAASLVAGKPDIVEEDGQPNARNTPIGTLHSNIAYHLGLAHYLKGDFARAIPIYQREIASAKNDDRVVSTAHWLYMSLRRLGRDREAAASLANIGRTMNVIENDTYHRLLLLYKGILPVDSVLSVGPTGEMSVTDATAAYGIANWHLYNGRRAEAERLFRRILAGGQWGSFGYIAAEAELARMPRRTGGLRVALAKQTFSPNGQSAGPHTMANGGIQQQLAAIGLEVKVQQAMLTPAEEPEYGGWKRLGLALGHYSDIVAQNERDGWFTVGLYATCPSMPGMVSGLQRSGANGRPVRVGMLWLDAHPDFNTPETTRSGSLGGMPVAVATGRALHVMRRDAKLEPALRDENVVMAGVRLTDPLEQALLDSSRIQQVSVADLQQMTPAVWRQLDRLSSQVDKLYIHIDMDVLDPREVAAHQNRVPGGPSSEDLAVLFEQIFRRYPKASAIGFATIPSPDSGGLAIAAVNRMIMGAVKGVQARR